MQQVARWGDGHADLMEPESSCVCYVAERCGMQEGQPRFGVVGCITVAITVAAGLGLGHLDVLPAQSIIQSFFFFFGTVAQRLMNRSVCLQSSLVLRYIVVIFRYRGTRCCSGAMCYGVIFAKLLWLSSRWRQRVVRQNTLSKKIRNKER